MNCKQCKHKQDWDVTHDGEVFWPCARGVASLPDGYFVRSQGKYGLVTVEDSQPLHKLPWLIDNHDCALYEEANETKGYS